MLRCVSSTVTFMTIHAKQAMTTRVCDLQGGADAGGQLCGARGHAGAHAAKLAAGAACAAMCL